MNQPEAAGDEHARIDRGAERADRVNAVQVPGHGAGRAAADLPAGQRRS
ncbi:MAG: hypothetical protein ACLP52_16165 [Streptosporangiaceae bacterium]